MPSTFFTTAPHWQWLIVAYFFLGGLSAGSYFLAVLMDRFARERDRPIARMGYLVAFPLACVCGLLLIVDLNRPERFWHMLIQNNTWWPMLKWYSPMSVGAWGLLIFSGFAFLSLVGELAETGWWRRWPALRRLHPAAPLGGVLGVVGGFFGFFLASYTGVLLAVTNRPIWADTNFLGMAFLVSAASTSAALLILLGAWVGARPDSLHALSRFETWMLALEILAVVVLVASLGQVARALANEWGILLAATAAVGMVVPLLLHWRRNDRGRAWWMAPALVLLGGAALRIVVVFASEAL
jgi:formate-dependent nitrite reductase membrane component NrfD